MSYEDKASDSRDFILTITYAKPGTRPPVFLAGSFSSPTWEPREMSYTERSPADGSGDVQFQFYANEKVGRGTWQYKFRLGPGDWWVLDDQAETGMRFGNLVLTHAYNGDSQ